MNKLFNKLYEKSNLSFALVWIGIYCITNSLAKPMSNAIGIDSSAALAVNIVLTAALFMWIRKNGLMTYYGLCNTNVSAVRFLWYIPLLLFMSQNLWLGFAVNLPLADTVCYILNMLCVGFLEEIIFRGFLFKALAKDKVKTAIVISSITFGLGHILNLFDGSVIENVCQIIVAIAVGFLFVIIFHRGGSLIPCIIAHSVNNAVSVFANERALLLERSVTISAISTAIVVVYTLILLITLPKNRSSEN